MKLTEEWIIVIISYRISGTRRIAEANQDIVCGFITQEKISDKLGLIHWTPGVSLDETTDGKGQQWRSVEKAIMEQQNDIVIVGRAICNKVRGGELIIEGT